MKNAYKILLFLMVIMLFVSCKKKFKQYENLEVAENTFKGQVSHEMNPDGKSVRISFEGEDRNSGVYSLVWVNNERQTNVDFEYFTYWGQVIIEVKDARGKKRFGWANSDEYNFGSETSMKGKRGNQLVQLTFDKFEGYGEIVVRPKID